MGLSGRGFGAFCILLAIAIMAANVASFLFLQWYWRWGFLLAPPLFFSGLVLVLFPDRFTRLDSGPSGVGAKLVGALVFRGFLGGLVLGGILAYDPVAAMRSLGLQ